MCCRSAVDVVKDARLPAMSGRRLEKQAGFAALFKKSLASRLVPSLITLLKLQHANTSGRSLDEARQRQRCRRCW